MTRQCTAVCTTRSERAVHVSHCTSAVVQHVARYVLAVAVLVGTVQKVRHALVAQVRAASHAWWRDALKQIHHSDGVCVRNLTPTALNPATFHSHGAARHHVHTPRRTPVQEVTSTSTFTVR
jgi:hypothetical protein